jgi:C-terminal processing protease CtpA/Prc
MPAALISNAGDVIEAIDGNLVADLTIEDITNLILGEVKL